MDTVGGSQITIGTADHDRLVSFVDEAFDQHCKACGVPSYSCEIYSLVATDARGETCGALRGKVERNWLYIAALVVSEGYRGQGIGRSLVKRAEAEVKEKGCVGIYLWTQSWQAPEFYEKCGFERFVTLPDFPKPHQRIGLLKRISGQGA